MAARRCRRWSPARFRSRSRRLGFRRSSRWEPNAQTAVEKLRDAGIGGTFSAGESIFYCSTWLQDEQERWHINVDVLFDKDGRVYAYRPDPHSPTTAAAREEEPGTAAISKPPKQVASAKQTGVVNPFAE